MSAKRTQTDGPLALLVGAMAILLLTSLAVALWLMEQEAPASAPEQPAPVAEPEPVAAAPEMVIAEPEPALEPQAPEPLIVLAVPEVTAPTRARESEPLDLAVELERLGIAQIDPAARATVIGLVMDGMDQPLPQTLVTLFNQRGDHITADFTDEAGQFRFDSAVPLLAGWSVSTGADPAMTMDAQDGTAPAAYIHAQDLRPGEEPVRVSLVVAAAPRMEGLVMDGSTGAPAGFAMVEVLSRSSAWKATSQVAFVEADGSFSLALTQMPASGLLLRASDATGRQIIVGPLTLSPGEVRWVELTLEAPVTVSGQVFDELSGAGLAGARVTALPSHPLIDRELLQTVCDGEGRFTLSGLTPSAERQRLHVEADGHSAELVLVSGRSDDLIVRLGRPVVLSGTIHDGVSGLTVRFAALSCVLPSMEAAGPAWADTVLCDEQGHFELTLRKVPPSAAMLLVESPGHVLSRRALADLVPVHLGSKAYTLRIDLDRTHAR